MESATSDKPAAAAAPTEIVLERRIARAMAEDSMKYSIDSVTRCPFPGCDSKGNGHCSMLISVMLIDSRCIA